MGEFLLICKYTIKQVIDHVKTGYVGKPDQDILLTLLEAQIPVEVPSRERTNCCKCPSCLRKIKMPTSIQRRNSGWFCSYCGQMLKYTQGR